MMCCVQDCTNSNRPLVEGLKVRVGKWEKGIPYLRVNGILKGKSVSLIKEDQGVKTKGVKRAREEKQREAEEEEASYGERRDGTIEA